MNIKEQNISGMHSPATCIQTRDCGHNIREVKGIKNFLSGECNLCYESLIGDKKLCIYDCGHIIHLDCFKNNLKVPASQNQCLTCINDIISVATYENSQNLEEAELYTCVDDECHEHRKQIRMVPFAFAKEQFAGQNQVDQNQAVQNEEFQQWLLEISCNISSNFTDAETNSLLDIIRSENLDNSAKVQHILNFLEGANVSVDYSNILGVYHSLPTTNPVLPDVNINASSSSSNATAANVDTGSTTSVATTSSNESQQQPGTSHAEGDRTDNRTRARRLSLETNDSDGLITEGGRVSFLNRVKKIFARNREQDIQ
jgi:hypothetical protein